MVLVFLSPLITFRPRYRQSFDYRRRHVTRRALKSLAVRRHSLRLMSSEHKPPDPRRCSVDVAAVRAARSTAGTHAPCPSLTLPVGGWVSPCQKGQAVCIIHQAAGIRCRSNLTAAFLHMFHPGKQKRGQRETLRHSCKGKKGAFVGFYFCAMRNKCLEYGEDSMIFLRRRRADTLPIRRWWQNTGG